MKRIRVLIAEDSLTVRKRLAELLGAQEDFEVVAEAEDGKQAVEHCRALRPDVITLDMMMPVMSGLAATETIMAYCPTPILIVSSSTNRGELFRSYDALAAGALDILEKPLGNEPDQVWESRFLATVRRVSRIKVITHPRAKLGQSASPSSAPSPSFPPPGSGARVLVLGASTGGPGAILEILKGLPSTFPVPILLVLHLGKIFASAFPEWLEGSCSLRVAYAQDGEPLPAPGSGRILMAPPDWHLKVRGRRLWLNQEPERHSCRPSVDVLFESVAQEFGPAAAGLLLTGMGRDGAAGLLAIRRAGGTTFAQDEASCVVFGMPREAILLGAAQRVLPLPHIAAALSGWAGGLSA
jgi:two-component system chemotaxis response regulator CheB